MNVDLILLDLAGRRIEEARERERLRETASLQQFSRAMERAYNSQPATFNLTEEIRVEGSAAPGYIPLDALRKTKPAKIGSFTRDPSLTRISNPTFSTTPEERGQERLREEKQNLEYIEKQVLESLGTIGEVKKNKLEELSRCHSKGENVCAVHDRDLGECMRELRQANGKLTGTVITGTACASQCQEDILNTMNGRPDLSHGEVREYKPRGKPIAEGRLS